MQDIVLDFVIVFAFVYLPFLLVALYISYPLASFTFFHLIVTFFFAEVKLIFGVISLGIADTIFEYFATILFSSTFLYALTL